MQRPVQPGDGQIGLERVDLAAEGVSSDPDVDGWC
jgi:hypothetical protein